MKNPKKKSVKYKSTLKQRAWYLREKERNRIKNALKPKRDKQLILDLRRKAKPYAQRAIHERLAITLRGRMKKHLKQALHITDYDFVKGRFIELIGCSAIELKKHLEAQFKEGMSWDNWGMGKGHWNIDHIKPISSFNVMDRDERLKASHYMNLQPLWFEENMRKGAKILQGSEKN